MIRITAVGDINLGGDFAVHAQNREGAFQRLRLFRYQLPPSDVVFANLEGPVTSQHPFYDDLFHITNPLWYPDVLADLGFNVGSLANNHIMDFGEMGLISTLAACHGKLLVTGAGRNLAEAQQPAVISTADGTKVCVIAMADEWPDGKHMIASSSRPGYWSLYHPSVERVVTECVAKFDVVIAYIHWGLLSLYQPKPDHRRFAHHLISLGVPLVIGSHCHHIQGFETVSGGLIAYGLGDFCFPRIVGDGFDLNFGNAARDSVVLHATILQNREVTQFKFVPWCFDDNDGLSRLTGEAAKAVLNEQRRLSRGFAARDYVKWFQLYNSRQPGSNAVRLRKNISRLLSRIRIKLRAI